MESDIGAAQSEIVFYNIMCKSVFGLNLTNIAFFAPPGASNNQIKYLFLKKRSKNDGHELMQPAGTYHDVYI